MSDSLPISPLAMDMAMLSVLSPTGRGGIERGASAPKALAGLDLNRTGSSDPERVLEEFQAVLLREMVKAMRATVPEASLFGEEGLAGEMFRSLLDEEYVRVAARQMGGAGLTEALRRQLGLDEGPRHSSERSLDRVAMGALERHDIRI